MTDLLQRLHAAPSGSRALSDEVLLALGWTFEPDKDGDPAKDWMRLDGMRCPFAPNVTESVDDCLSLVPEGWRWSATTIHGHGYVELTPKEGQRVDGYGNGVPLAFCEALIKTHEAKENGNG